MNNLNNLSSPQKFEKNVVLVGMMGSGKTTIGEQVAEKLGMDFVDTDDYIEKHTGLSIAEIFKSGEEYFRDIEAKSVLKLSVLNSCVISTGGGTVIQKENIINLGKKGIVFFIDRPIENIVADIEIEKRPLLEHNKNRVFEIFDERYELYKKRSDIIIKNDGTIEKAVRDIIKNYYMLCAIK